MEVPPKARFSASACSIQKAHVHLGEQGGRPLEMLPCPAVPCPPSRPGEGKVAPAEERTKRHLTGYAHRQFAVGQRPGKVSGVGPGPHPALDPVSLRLEPALLVGPGQPETPLDLSGGIVTATRQKVRLGEHGHVPGVGRHEPESGRLGGGLLAEPGRPRAPARSLGLDLGEVPAERFDRALVRAEARVGLADPLGRQPFENVIAERLRDSDSALTRLHARSGWPVHQ